MFCFLVPSVTVAVSAHVTQWLAHCNPHSNHRIRCSAVEKCELFLIPSAPRRRHRDKTWICAISDLISQRETLLFSSSPLAERPRRHPASHTMCTRIRGREAKHSRKSDADVKKARHHISIPPQNLSCRALNETQGQIRIHHTTIHFLPNLFLITSRY
jgi:hypothetical protein